MQDWRTLPRFVMGMARWMVWRVRWLAVHEAGLWIDQARSQWYAADMR